MTDRILLTGVEIFAYGGVTPEERRIGQRYRVDIDLSLLLAEAGRTDDLNLTISYAEVHGTIVEAMREAPFNLIEAAAERIAERILTRYPVEAVTVTVAKLLPPIDGVVASAAVVITRRQA